MTSFSRWTVSNCLVYTLTVAWPSHCISNTQKYAASKFCPCSRSRLNIALVQTVIEAYALLRFISVKIRLRINCVQLCESVPPQNSRYNPKSRSTPCVQCILHVNSSQSPRSACNDILHEMSRKWLKSSAAVNWKRVVWRPVCIKPPLHLTSTSHGSIWFWKR